MPGRSCTLDGNRTSKVEDDVTTDYTFDRTDMLVNQTSTVTTDFTYDAYGNMTKKAESASTQTVMAYDAANRLTAITPASGTGATFTLDALGRFATRLRSSGGTDTYAYLGAGETVAEISNSVGGTIRSMLDPGGSRLATRAGTAAATFTLFDQLGSLIGLVGSTRTITEATRFDGYGESVDHYGATSSPWRFRGHLDISPTGDALYDMGARFYAPGIGAFTQMDTVAGSAQDPLSMNRFLYAQGNPATLIDPTGHMAASGQLCPWGPDDCSAPGVTYKPPASITAGGGGLGGTYQNNKCSGYTCTTATTGKPYQPPQAPSPPTPQWTAAGDWKLGERTLYLGSPDYLYTDRWTDEFGCKADTATCLVQLLKWYSAMVGGIVAPNLAPAIAPAVGGAAATGGTIGGAAYLGSTWVGNYVNGSIEYGKGAFYGADPADFSISVVAGAASGGASGLTALGGTARQVAVNAVIGGTAAGASGAVHGTLNPLDVAIGATVGAAGAKLPGAGKSLGTSQTLKGLLAGVGQNSVATWISQWFRDLPSGGFPWP